MLHIHIKHTQLAGKKKSLIQEMNYNSILLE